MIRESALTAARARITWGESPESIRSFLITEGFTREEADASLKDLSSERNSDVRRRGIKNAVVGGICLAAGGGLGAALLFGNLSKYTLLKINGRLVGLSILCAGFGLWKLINGLIDFFAPSQNTSAISDVN